MRNTPARIPRLFVILSLALAGLMILQVMLLRYAWDLKEQAFTRGAQSALAATVVALESREIEGSAYDLFFSQNDSSYTISQMVVPQPRVPRMFEYSGPATAPGVKHFPNTRPRLVRESYLRDVEGEMGALGQDSIVVIMSTSADIHTDLTAARHGGRAIALRHVVGDWINRAPLPIGERLKKVEIAEVLQEELAKVGISATPRFGVVRPGGKTFFDFDFTSDGRSTATALHTDEGAEIILASDDITDAELLASPYRHRLFPLDPFGSPFDLVMAFPEGKIYLFWQIWPLWLASILFITVIVFSFAKAWRTNAEQRRFADQLVDFINNMTHEFKTPISTVGLAGEAITREDVRSQPQVLERYVGMIRDENERMHRQVEKILQMARFERGDIELKHEPIAIPTLLSAVADSFALQIEQRGGTLECVLPSGELRVHGDRVHLESIFGNLVDNAVKYSPDAPLVKISAAVDDGFILVKVTDQGKGIARENQRRVFEKYYRCPTGNLHDVKGYGLGLSFVQSLVTAHGGFVELHSLPGQGTTVTVSLPLLNDNPKDKA